MLDLVSFSRQRHSLVCYLCTVQCVFSFWRLTLSILGTEFEVTALFSLDLSYIGKAVFGPVREYP